jgi:hypothetical protein
MGPVLVLLLALVGLWHGVQVYGSPFMYGLAVAVGFIAALQRIHSGRWIYWPSSGGRSNSS